MDDLHGQTLWLCDRGIADYQTGLRDDLEQNHPQIQLKSAPYLDINTFNRLATSQELILSAQCWSSVHLLVEAGMPMPCISGSANAAASWFASRQCRRLCPRRRRWAGRSRCTRCVPCTG